MNERIRELAEQAELAEAADVRGGFIYPSGTEKFAELIVKECMNICDEVQDQYGQYTFTARICKERFQEHFGVDKSELLGITE